MNMAFLSHRQRKLHLISSHTVSVATDLVHGSSSASSTRQIQVFSSSLQLAFLGNRVQEWVIEYRDFSRRCCWVFWTDGHLDCFARLFYRKIESKVTMSGDSEAINRKLFVVINSVWNVLSGADPALVNELYLTIWCVTAIKTWN